MALDRIQYDMLDKTNELDLLDNLHYVERLDLEVNTNGITVTPTITLSNVSFALQSVSNTTRGFIEVPVNRIGSIDRLTITPFARIDWFQVELFLRPVVYKIKNVPTGNVSAFAGRTTSIATNIIFDVEPFTAPEDPRLIDPVIRRLYIDAQTGTQTFQPELTFDDGSTLTLAVVDTVGRSVTEYSIIQPKRLKTLTLNGDFSSDEIIVYSVESDLYVPNKRRMAVG